MRKFILISMLLYIAILSAQVGTLNQNFGVNGMLLGEIDTAVNDENVNYVTVQPDGKILASGYTFTDSNTIRPFIVRYLPNGTLDPTFGLNGVVHPAAISIIFYKTAVDINGKIIAVGRTAPTISSQFQNCYITRFLENGQLDTTFGTNGSTTIALDPASDYMMDVLALPDGRYITGAIATTASNIKSAYLMMFTANGFLDSSFNGNGKKNNVFGNTGQQQIYNMELREDGSILAMGFGNGNKIVAVKTTGDIDTSFGNNGVIELPMNVINPKLKIHPDGSIRVMSHIYEGEITKLVTFKFFSNGALDPSFGISGISTHAPFGVFKVAYPAPPVLYPDGRYMIGWRYRVNFVEKIGITWFNKDGSLSPSGTVLTDLNGSEQQLCFSLARAPDGDLIVANAAIAAPINVSNIVLLKFNGGLLNTSDTAIKNTVALYPNPTTGLVSVSNTQNTSIDKIEIADSSGKLIATKTRNTSQIDLSKFPIGIYFFKIFSGKSVFQKKIIKQ